MKVCDPEFGEVVQPRHQSRQVASKTVDVANRAQRPVRPAIRSAAAVGSPQPGRTIDRSLDHDPSDLPHYLRVVIAVPVENPEVSVGYRQVGTKAIHQLIRPIDLR
jgi:hypothetical protein